MTTYELKTQIEQSIKSFSRGNLRENGIRLLRTLGYASDRQVILEPNTYAGFVEVHPALAGINKQKAIVDNWLSVDILFQLTGEDLKQMTQGRLIFDKKRIDNQIIESYLFLAIELKSEDYSRTRLADTTREVNKFFAMPVMILFKYGEQLTLSIINRRLHKKDESKDVLEKVTLIKGINIKNPIRAHIEILFDLSLSELEKAGQMHSFVELHKAWQKTLDISELNKRFYREIANWYFYAVEHVEFPKGTTEDRQIRNATNVIRLITRLIFVWFIKEKGLVPDALFNPAQLKEILNFNDPQSSTYYKAILQNLFFATLNTEMGADRRFRGKNNNPNGLDAHHGISTVYRYEDYFKDPAKGLALFAGIPFLNGGLFECLDKREEKMLVDGFSDDPRNQPVVPDSLFFGDELTVDLSEVYGDKRHNKEKVRGLIRIFDSYKFTIEENTPLDEEIALDPELLGKVFENLLAAYNPETGTTARKQTGSFYTPREIVNYMVDESLIAYLENSLGGDELNNDEKPLLESKLRNLLAYNNEPHQFNAEEADQIISAIDKVKVLDPACGSGAFPMGVLHKLVFILNKLDPGNVKWKERQLAKAAEIPDATVRDQVIEDIEKAFTDNELDYGRKLYLIENCIYGVDIQPIAVQIAKLRFFISLVVEQTVDRAKPNLGIRPLPNLESKFVAANTLIGIEKPQQLLLHNPAIDEKEKQLSEVRDSLFTARTPATKRKYREQDRKLREEIVALLKSDGWNNVTASQLANWDPYDQNTNAEFFDPEWMFGVDNGFSIVIANPPYVDSEIMSLLYPELREWCTSKYRSAQGNWDMFVVFVEKGLQLVTQEGILSYIIPNKIIAATYSESIRSVLGSKCFIEIRDYSKVRVFDQVAVYPVTIVLSNKLERKPVRVTSMLSVQEVEYTNQISSKLFYADIDWGKWFAPERNLSIIMKCLSYPPISQYYSFSSAATVNDAYEIKKIIKDIKPNTSQKFKKLINTGTIDKYAILWGVKGTQYIKDNYQTPIIFDEDLLKYSQTRYDQASSIKIVVGGMTKELECAFDEDGSYLAGKSTAIVTSKNRLPLKYALALMNSKLISFWYKNWFSSLSLAGGYIRISHNNLSTIPIPIIDQNDMDLIIKIVDLILSKKAKNPNNDTEGLEKEIDDIVYRLYGLTEEEILVVEGKPSGSSRLNPELEETTDKTVDDVTDPTKLNVLSTQSDYDLYKCSLCGKLVLGHDRANHSKEDHRGQDEWTKLKK